MEKVTKGRIERANTYLVVPHLDEETRFSYPGQGPGNYQNAGKAVIAERLSLANGWQTASLLNEVYNSKNPEFKDSKEANFIRQDVMKQKYLWVFNRNLWTPSNAENAGVYVQYDAQAKGMSEILQVKDLEEALSKSNGGFTENGVRFSQNGLTAFAPYNTMKAGSHDKGTLANNGFVLASYGVEGAEKLDNVAKTFPSKPYVWLVDNTGNNSLQSLSALGRGCAVGGRLDVDGGSGCGSGGYAFGVNDSAEGKVFKKNKFYLNISPFSLLQKSKSNSSI